MNPKTNCQRRRGMDLSSTLPAVSECLSSGRWGQLILGSVPGRSSLNIPKPSECKLTYEHLHQ